MNILLDSLPFIRQFQNQIMVIKYGGAAQINPDLKLSFAKDIALLHLLGIKVVIVHGGGRSINEMLDRLEIASEFVDGVRVTSQEAMPVVEMVLSGNINKELCDFLNTNGARAVGISGKDGHLFGAVSESGNYTGKITKVDPSLIYLLLDGGFVPVIAPIAYGESLKHEGFNINADYVACEIAKAINASKIIFLTDIKGVLDQNNKLIPTLDEELFETLKKENVITGGMIPKLQSCFECTKNNVQKAHIIDGRIKHSLLLELFTSGGIGTEIY
ncbi:acetylglutamate kinase [Helicobacter anatolicus]|uniref:acetylglutamate kinase n=1 Tax=Helicobacter anatolicus TaxID=2905874 RepID=UPI001E3B6D42|nr:acetylglutamate kinase [Helicobacter anatolicus]